MLGLGTSILSPYVGGETPYTNTHSLSLDGAGTGSDVDMLSTNTPLQSQLRNSFSFSMWVKLDEGQPSQSKYFIAASSGTDIIGFAVGNTGKLSFLMITSGAGSVGRAIINSNAVVFSSGASDWTHLGVVTTETGGTSSHKMYVNGQEEASTLSLGLSAAQHSGYTSSTNVAFGGFNTTNPSGGIDGLIDECAFFDDALTDAEMLAIGGGGAPTDITGHDHLFLYYKLNNTTTDEVGNSNGSLLGQAAFSTTTP